MLAFEHDSDNDWRISNKIYYIPNLEIKDYNVMIDENSFFDQPLKNDKVSMKILEKLLLVKGITIQMVVCWTIPISKNITK